MFHSKIKLFLITLFPFLFSVNAFAGRSVDSSGNTVYTFLVDNPSMVDAYFNIFNAMASFFQSNDYLELLKVVFLLGGLSVFFIGVMKVYQGGDAKGSLGEFVKYMILGTALLTIIFSHKSQMIITTKQLNSFCTASTSSSSIVAADPYSTGVVVGNIPEVLAWTFSLVNEVGRETTRLATMAFTAADADLTTYASRSDYASYLQGIGTVLSSDLSKFTKKNGNTDSMTLLTGLESMFRDCIAAPAANTGSNGALVMTAFSNTGDLRKTLENYIANGQVNTYKNPTDSSTIQTLITNYTVNGVLPKNLLVTVNGDTYTCEQVFNIINASLDSLISGDELICSGNLKDYWNSQTMAIFTGDSATITEPQGKMIVLNAALANQVMDSKNNIAPAELSYASGKSTAEFVTNSLGTGYYMAQMLPYLQMGMRAVMYAFFPFVFIVILLPGGMKVLISYLQTLIWIELWSPTAAVLNMFLSIMATDKFADMYQKQGVNATQGLQTFSDAAMLASVAGYLYASVPALTWLILKGSGQMLGNITGAIGARMSANMNTDSINKDMQQISSNRKLNEQRRARGEEMISLAEQDSLTAKMAGWESAGTFDQKSKNMDKLFNASSAKELVDISKNSTAGDMYMNNPNAKKNLAALESQVSGDIHKTTGEKTYTGEVNENGGKNSVKTQDINTALGQDSGATKLGTDLQVKELKHLNKGDMQAAYDAKALGTVETMKSQQDYLETQAKIHKVDPKAEHALSEMVAAQAQTEANRKALEQNTEAKYQKNVLNTDSNNESKDARKYVNGVAAPLAAKKTVDTQTQQGLFSNFSTSERVGAALNKESADIGTNLAKAASLAAGLDMIAKDKSNPDSARAEKLYNTLIDKNASQGEKLQALADASGIKSVVGAANQVYNGISGDTQAKDNTNAGLTAIVQGNMKADTDQTNVTKFSGNEKGEGGIYNELNDHDQGKKVLSDSAKALKITDEQLNQKDENGNLTFNALANRRNVANNAVETLKASPEAYNAMLKEGSLEELKKHITLEENQKASGEAEAIKTKTTENVVRLLGVEGSAASKSAQEILTAVQTPVKMVKIIEDYGKKFPGLKNQLTKISDQIKNSNMFKENKPFNLGDITNNLQK